MKKLFLPAIGLLLFAGICHAEVGIEAAISPSQVAVGQPLTLTVVVNGAASGVKPPKLPTLANFRSYSQGHSQELSFINGKMTSRNVFSFVLIPSVPGKHVIGQLEIEIESRIYKTGVLEVEVIEAGASAQTAPRAPTSGPFGSKTAVTPPPPRSLPPEYMAGKDVFVRAWADKEEVYVNEPVYLTYTVYTRVSATFKGFEEEPETTGFWVEEFPPSSMNRQEKELGGQRYVVADVRTVALFPTDTGTFTVKPGILKVEAEIMQRNGFDQFQSNDIFGWRTYRRPASYVTQIVPKLLATDPIHVTVKPLPEEGKPADFNGAVGRFKLSATVDRARVEEGEPITYRLQLQGEGNLNTVELPKLPEIEHFKMYDSSSSTKTSKERLVVEGEKTLETVLIAKKPGRFTIPSVSFSYFDPGLKRYQILKTEPLTVDVAPSKDEPGDAPIAIGPGLTQQAASLVAEDIRFIRTSPGTLRAPSEPLYREDRYWWINLGILAAALFLLLTRLLAEKAGSNVVGNRFRRSHRVARRRLKQARANLKKGSEKNFYESISQALYGYFSDKFNLGPGEFSMELVDTKLAARVTPGEAVRLKEVITSIHLGRFGRTEGSLDDMKKLYGECDEMITSFEAKKINKGPAFGLLVLLLLGGTPFAAHAAESPFASSVAAYQKGDYASAAKALESILASGQESEAVYYNLGNAYFKLNQKAKSAWAYERALRLNPRDEDVKWNLELLRKQLSDKYQEPSRGGLAGWVIARSGVFTGAELSFAFSGCLGFLSFLLVFYAFVPPSRRALGTLIFLSFLATAAAGGVIWLRAQEAEQPSAIIADREIYARYGPTGDSTKAFLLHEGAKIRVLKTSGDWRWIQYGDGQKGWLSKESLLVL